MEVRPLLGSGRTADVHAWADGRVVKLLRPELGDRAAREEHALAVAVRDCAFPKPAVHDLVHHDGRWGVVYDRVDGESLESWALRTSDVDGCARVLAEVQDAIARCAAPASLPGFRDVLAGHLERATLLPVGARDRALAALDRLPDGSGLCHGDLHPGNVLLAADGPQVIDFTNLCRGPALYDVARTVHLVQRTPVPPGTADLAAMQRLKDAVAEAYLARLGVDRRELAPYQAVVAAARVGEAPEERTDL